MHSRLETYLSEVAAQLQSLPTKRREEELREMRAHLESAVAAGREQGQTEDEAAQSAIAQFGVPEAVGQKTVTAWRRGVMRNRRSFWGAAVCTLTVLFLVPLLLGPFEEAYFNPVSPAHLPTAQWVFFGFNLAGPILAGAMSGLLFSKRVIAGTAFGSAINFALCMVVFVYIIDHPGLATVGPRGEPASRTVFLLFIRSIQSGLVTLFAAWVGSRWRARRMRLVQS